MLLSVIISELASWEEFQGQGGGHPLLVLCAYTLTSTWRQLVVFTMVCNSWHVNSLRLTSTTKLQGFAPIQHPGFEASLILNFDSYGSIKTVIQPPHTFPKKSTGNTPTALHLDCCTLSLWKRMYKHNTNVGSHIVQVCQPPSPPYTQTSL